MHDLVLVAELAESLAGNWSFWHLISCRQRMSGSCALRKLAHQAFAQADGIDVPGGDLEGHCAALSSVASRLI